MQYVHKHQIPGIPANQLAASVRLVPRGRALEVTSRIAVVATLLSVASCAHGRPQSARKKAQVQKKQCDYPMLLLAFPAPPYGENIDLRIKAESPPGWHRALDT